MGREKLWGDPFANYFNYDDVDNPTDSTDSAGVHTDTDYAANIMNGSTIAAAGLVSNETKHAPGVSMSIGKGSGKGSERVLVLLC